VEIAGFKTEIANIQETLDFIEKIKYNCCDACIIQLMDAKAIAGKKHIEHGILHGMNAFKRKENIANDIGIEICIRISAQRQISKALDILGLKKGKMEIVAVLINCPDYFIDELNSYFTRDDDVLDPDLSILKDIYDIPQKELETLSSIDINIADVLMDRTSALIVEL
jgi:KEOPS complex subunit Cgi121